MKKHRNFCRLPYCAIPNTKGQYDKPVDVTLRSWMRGLRETWGSEIGFINSHNIKTAWLTKYMKENNIDYGNMRTTRRYSYGERHTIKFMRKEDAVLLRMSYPD